MKRTTNDDGEKKVLRMMIVACIIMIVITILTIWILVPKINQDKPEEPTVKSGVMAAPKAQAATTYEPKYTEKNIFLKVDGSTTGDEAVNLRSEPAMSDKYKVGKLTSGTEFISNVLYSEGDFYGFPVGALEGVYSLSEEDPDGILWMSKYYLHASVYEYPETQEGIEARQKEWIPTELTTLTIVGGNPRVRSTPTSKDMGNVYGTFSEGTVIRTSSPIVVDCDSYTFYGIPVADVEGHLNTMGYGHLWYDADGLVWVSSAYAEATT